jgi:hypothetical protein
VEETTEMSSKDMLRTTTIQGTLRASMGPAAAMGAEIISSTDMDAVLQRVGDVEAIYVSLRSIIVLVYGDLSFVEDPSSHGKCIIFETSARDDLVSVTMKVLFKNRKPNFGQVKSKKLNPTLRCSRLYFSLYLLLATLDTTKTT